MKTIERAHTPAKLWEVIKLSENYKQALAQIDQHLQYWPDKLIHRNKQRLTKIWQYLIRMRRLRNKVRPTIITINQKIERREKTRERKALSAALVDQEIKKELIERLKQVRMRPSSLVYLWCILTDAVYLCDTFSLQGTYGGIYNFAQESFDQVLNEEGIEDEALFVPAGEEEEYVEDDDEMYADLEHGPGDWDSVDGDDDEDAGDDEEDAGRGEQETGGDDDSDDLDASRPKRPTKKRPLDKPKPSTSQKKRSYPTPAIVVLYRTRF
jgi:protein MAK16